MQKHTIIADRHLYIKQHIDMSHTYLYEYKNK